MNKTFNDAYKNYEKEWMKENPPFSGPYTNPYLTKEEFIKKHLMETKRTKEEMEKSKTELLNQLTEMNISSENLDWINQQLDQTINEEVEGLNDKPDKENE